MKKNKNAVLILLNYGIVVALLLMIAIFSFTSKNFFRTSTMFTILKQVSITGIVCIGQTMVMLTGGIDLSVGWFCCRCISCNSSYFLKEL